MFLILHDAKGEPTHPAHNIYNIN